MSDVRRVETRLLRRWTRKLDHADIAKTGIWVSARGNCGGAEKSKPGVSARGEARSRNVRSVAEKQKPQDWKMEVERGVTVASDGSDRSKSIGCYIPGGRFALVSTLIMTVVPAQVAGVKEIIAVCPHPNDELLATAGTLGITRLARIGGAQAIAAMAYGTKKIPRVEKIFGPGNRYVTAAKQIVSANCAIDLPAGPTEAVVLAERGNAKWIAADLLAQAEHAPDAGSYLVTTSKVWRRK